MTKTAKRQLKKNNTKKMKGGIGFYDTWDKKPILNKPSPNLNQRKSQVSALYNPNNSTHKKEVNTDKKNENHQEENVDSDDETYNNEDNNQDIKSKDGFFSNITRKITGMFSGKSNLNGGRRRNTKKATRKAKKGGRIAKKGARKANKSRRTRK